MQFNKYTHTHKHTHTHTKQVSLIPPWEDQCEWHRMTRMAGPDCAVMCNLINTYSLSLSLSLSLFLTHNRVLHQALARSLRESKVQSVVEDTWPFQQRASEQNGRLYPLRMDITTEAGALFDNHPRLQSRPRLRSLLPVPRTRLPLRYDALVQTPGLAHGTVGCSQAAPPLSAEMMTRSE